MARKLRVEYEGAIYHVLNRGDRQEPIFRDDRDRELFIATLAEACAKTDWQVHAYCLMSNHFHLALETPTANLVAGMKWFLGTYTGRFNRRHKVFGHLFSGRYKSLIVDGSGDGYLRTLSDYIHLNPVRARLLGDDEKLSAYPWSSFPAYLMAPRKRPDWLRVDRMLGDAGIPKDSTAGRSRFERRMEERRFSDDPEAYSKIRRGWCLGDKTFRKELLASMGERMGSEHYGDDRHESDEHKAEGILRAQLRAGRLTPAKLKKLPKGHPNKVDIAVRLRMETTMTVGWIAERLFMGSRAYAYRLLYLQRKR